MGWGEGLPPQADPAERLWVRLRRRHLGPTRSLDRSSPGRKTRVRAHKAAAAQAAAGGLRPTSGGAAEGCSPTHPAPRRLASPDSPRARRRLAPTRYASRGSRYPQRSRRSGDKVPVLSRPPPCPGSSLTKKLSVTGRLGCPPWVVRPDSPQKLSELHLQKLDLSGPQRQRRRLLCLLLSSSTTCPPSS